MATFVLVHGAFHGAWCWVKLIPALEARGHRAVAFDLPGQGNDPTPIGEVTLAGNVERINAVIVGEREPVVLVGHSLGGVSISAAAEAAPERIALLIYLAAFLPRDGESIASISASPASRQDSGRGAFIKAPDGLSFSAVPDRAAQVFYPDCSAEDVAYAVPRFRPQAYSVQRAPVHLTSERFGAIPRAYIECLRDNAVSLGLQRDMAAKSPCRTVVSLPTGHSPFFSHPDLLADVLVRLAEEP